jgi:acetyl-CoA carboxylase carboxyltransferase component
LIVNTGLEPEITATDLELESIIPDADREGYDMHEILLRVFDDGDLAVIGAESAVDIAGRRQLLQVPEEQRAAVREFMIDQYNATVATPWIAAERGYIDAVIEPSRTRLEIRHAVELLRDQDSPYPM